MPRRDPPAPQGSRPVELADGSHRTHLGSRCEGAGSSHPPKSSAGSAATLDFSIDRLPVDGVLDAPRHLAQDILGNRLAVVGELPADDLAPFMNIIDGLVVESRLKALAYGLGWRE